MTIRLKTVVKRWVKNAPLRGRRGAKREESVGLLLAVTGVDGDAAAAIFPAPAGTYSARTQWVNIAVPITGVIGKGLIVDEVAAGAAIVFTNTALVVFPAPAVDIAITYGE